MIIFDDFYDFLLLIRANDREDFPDNHFDKSGVILYEFIFELTFIQESMLCGIRLIGLFIVLLGLLFDSDGVFQCVKLLLKLHDLSF